ncbi:MAG: molecular chaperone TorD family protein [Bryobacterales bacterium]|nr:molecular chaperone TorD family protein [Bryobacterales bacterium]
MDVQVTKLLSEAAEWRLLGLLFEYPGGQWRANLSAVIDAVTDPELRAMGEAALEQFTDGLHFALFGPAGTVPVREVTYQGGVQLGYLMSELSAYYEAFGYEPRVEEAPDHLAIQLGFLSFLKLKQARALSADEPAQAVVAAEAAVEFANTHLALQAEPVLHRLEEFAPDFLVAAGRRIVAHTGPAPRSEFPLGSIIGDRGDEDEMMCCGDASAAL